MAQETKTDNGNLLNYSIQRMEIMEQRGFINRNKPVKLPDIIVPALHQPMPKATTTPARVNAVSNQPPAKK